MASYFIDYENVRVGGFQGLENLTQEDKVYIFYTENADTMTFGLHRRLQESVAQICYIRVTAGRNALDFQLASYLGYRIAQAPEECYTIVSKDNGFVPLVRFWGEKQMHVEMRPSLGKKMMVEEEYTLRGGRKNIPLLERGRREEPVQPEKAEATAGNVEIVEAITEPAQEPKENPEPASEPSAEAVKPIRPKKTRRKPKTEKTQESEEKDSLFESVLGMIAYPDKAQTVWKYVTKYKTKQGLNNALVKAYGSDIAGEIYKSIKPLLADKKAK